MKQLPWILVLAFALACGDDDGSFDAGTDTSLSDAPIDDAMSDAGSDAGDDAGVDASMLDVGPMDAPTDVPGDTAIDAPVDAPVDSPDAPADPCDPNPCFMDGTCTPDGASFTCAACPTGFVGDGEVCTDIDGCAGDPCFAGVMCTDVAAPGTGFMCGACPTGTMGDGITCMEIDGCVGDPCFAGVMCTDVAAPGTGFSCGPCPTGFTGDGEMCTDTDGCIGDPCFAGVMCTDVVAPGTGFTCDVCPAGFSGDGITCTSFAGLVVNEIDYDQPGADTAEFVEIANTSGSDISLLGLSIIFMNGSGGEIEYGRESLDAAGTLAAGDHLVLGDASVLASLPGGTPSLPLATTVQNGADAVGLFRLDTGELIDALSYEGALNNGTVTGVGDFDFVEGTAATAADSSTIAGSMIRHPDGTDTDDADADWRSTTFITPGAANAFCAAPNPTAGARPIVFEALDTDGDVVVLRNTSAVDQPIGTWWVCVRPAYRSLPAGTTIPAGATLTVHLASSGVDTATEIFLNDARFDVMVGAGELGLYNTNMFGSAAAMEAFVVWGAAASSPTCETVAQTAGLWTVGDFVPVTGAHTAIVATGLVTTSAGYVDVDGVCVP